MKSKIEWTDATWNPVTGCTKVSTGCKHCYAERLFPRVYGKDRKFTDVKLHSERLEQPLHWKKPRMIFVNSMSDLFHEDVPFEFIEKIWDTMFNCLALKRGHIFQILTKRPEEMLKFIVWMEEVKNRNTNYENIWLGISCENQATADERIPILLQVPAAVRFLSCEPLLDEIDLRAPLNHYPVQTSSRQYVTQEMAIDAGDRELEGSLYSDDEWEQTVPEGIDWVIVGGESGPNARPMFRSWARDICDQCNSAKVPFFFKQWGEWGNVTSYSMKGIDHPTLPTYLTDNGEVVALRDEEYSFEKLMGKIGKKKAGRLLDGNIWDEYPDTLKKLTETE